MTRLNGAEPQHFLDLIDHSDRRTARHPRRGRGDEGRARGERRGHAPARRQDAGDDLRAPSTRTRVSFDVGMRQLGGETIMLTGAEMQLGRGETIADTARVLSRYVDAIMIRILDHDDLLELARYATVPVINGLTKQSHPCQVMADILTFEEHRGPIRGRKVAWSGDDNNVLSSWIDASARFDFELDIACPPELAAARPSALDAARAGGRRRRARRRSGQRRSPAPSAVISDTWVSMGDEDESAVATICSRPIRSTPS